MPSYGRLSLSSGQGFRFGKSRHELTIGQNLLEEAVDHFVCPFFEKRLARLHGTILRFGNRVSLGKDLGASSEEIDVEIKIQVGYGFHVKQEGGGMAIGTINVRDPHT